MRVSEVRRDVGPQQPPYGIGRLWRAHKKRDGIGAEYHGLGAPTGHISHEAAAMPKSARRRRPVSM